MNYKGEKCEKHLKKHKENKVKAYVILLLKENYY
jgi:hypothetical protein